MVEIGALALPWDVSIAGVLPVAAPRRSRDYQAVSMIVPAPISPGA
jgi:hypothetical protein